MNFHVIYNIKIYIFIYTYVYKTQETFKKTFKCSRKLSHFPSGRALKCLSWPDGIIPCLSPQMSQGGGGGLCLLESQSPSGTAEGPVLPTPHRLSREWTCHG